MKILSQLVSGMVLLCFTQISWSQDCTEVLKYAQMDKLYKEHVVDWVSHHSGNAKSLAMGMAGTVPGAALAAASGAPVPIPGDVQATFNANREEWSFNKHEEWHETDRKFSVHDLSEQASKIYETCMQARRGGLNYFAHFDNPKDTDEFSVAATFDTPLLAGSAFSRASISKLTADLSVQNGYGCSRIQGDAAEIAEKNDVTHIKFTFDAMAPYTVVARCHRHHAGQAVVRMTSPDWTVWPDAKEGILVPDFFDDTIRVSARTDKFYHYVNREGSGAQAACGEADSRSSTGGCIQVNGRTVGPTYQIVVDGPPGYRTESVQFIVKYRIGESKHAPVAVNGPGKDNWDGNEFKFTSLPGVLTVRVAGKIGGDQSRVADTEIATYGAGATSFDIPNIHFSVVDRVHERHFDAHAMEARDSR